MKLTRMTAAFGRLDQDTLELKEGLNIIQAPNEGGKSTWAAFLKAMLYGIDTRERDRKGALADKNRYQPWSGRPMEGELALKWLGRDILLRRGPRGNVPMGSFSAVYAGSGEPVEGLSESCCGELLVGAGREVYERSAFLGQGGAAVGSTPELERRIAALVSSGEEDVSPSQVRERLKEWLRRRQYNRSGLIPRLEEELAQVEATLGEMERAAGEQAQARARRVELEERRRQLEEEAQAYRRLDQDALNGRFFQAAQALQEAQKRCETLEGELGRFGEIPKREKLKGAQGELGYLKALEEEIRQGEEALKKAEEAWEEARRAALDDRFGSMTGQEAAQRAAEDQAAAQRLLDRAAVLARRRPLSLLFLAACLALSAGAAFGLHLSVEVCAGVGAGIGLVLAGLCVALLGGARKKNLEKATALLRRYRVQQPQEIARAAEEYARREEEARRAHEALRTLRGSLNDRKARRDNSRGDLLDFVHTFAPEVHDLFGCSAAISRALNIEDRLALARERREGARKLYDELSAQGGQLVLEAGGVPIPEHTREEVAQGLHAAEGALEQVERALAQTQGARDALGNQTALEARREELAEELERRRTEYQALTQALEVLDRAEAALRERFSPALNRRAGELLSRLTAGRYREVTLTRELEASARGADSLMPRRTLELSQGTAEQVYLAVRLAICQLCLPQDDPAPLVLDDALVTFDGERLALALDTLAELAKERQILLFTCQDREARWARGREDVNLIRL